MIVFRLSKKKYAKDFNGKGAAMFGNRWNSKGIEIIYTAESRALAMAEVAVHLTLATLPSDYVMIEIEIPEKIKFDTVDSKKLNWNWNSFPHKMDTQLIGDQLIHENKWCLLKVPSAVVKGDFNVLINPYHAGFKKIKIVKITPFPFDERLFQNKE